MTGARTAHARGRAGAGLLGVARVSWSREQVLALALVAVLTAIAAMLRVRAWSAPYWIDEAISVGIASHPPAEIPGLLRLDGSPPLYYLLLHGWMALFGREPTATHALSTLLAVLAVPAGAWAAWGFAGGLAAVACAALLALDPFVGVYADETRMYTLALLLALLATGAFVRAFVGGSRAAAVGFGLLLAGLLYTHGWGAFYGVAAGAAVLLLLAVAEDRRRLLTDAVLAFGLAAVLFAPWLPTLLEQVRATGAPWSSPPSIGSLERAGTRMLGGQLPAAVLLLASMAGLALLAVRDGPAARRAAGAALTLAAGTLLVAWEFSRLAEPAWALRYLVVVLAPLAVLLATGLARLGALATALALAAAFLLGWQGKPERSALANKSNVAEVADELAPHVPPGTLVFSAQPEQVPNLALHLPPGLRYVTPLGVVRETSVMDWRHALPRLRAASYDRVLRPVARRLAPGALLLVVVPRFEDANSPWTTRVRGIAARWRRALGRDGFSPVVASSPARGHNRSTVQAVLLRKRGRTARAGSPVLPSGRPPHRRGLPGRLPGVHGGDGDRARGGA